MLLLWLRRWSSKTVQKQACCELHGSHVVEGVVQLLADGLVLQFLGIQLIYRVVIIIEWQ